VFLAGASGVIGRRLIPLLVAAGHDVIGLTRSEAKSPALATLGATPVVGNVFDLDRLRLLMTDARPQAVISELTDLPQQFDLRKLSTYYAANNRVRREGTANVLTAARDAGATRAIVESMAIWYAPAPGPPRTETDPLYVTAPEPVGEAVRTLKAMEDHALASGLDAILLRYGAFYGPGTWLEPGGAFWTETKNRRYPVIGDGKGIYSWIHVDDAARATVVALERAAPGIYNVVDDDPAPAHAWLPVYAEAIGAPPPRHVPQIIARLIGGGFVDWQATVPAASNRKIKEQLGWVPEYRSWRKGFLAAQSAATTTLP
jgi:nucleoside-diphosphate-sugar epimerase